MSSVAAAAAAARRGDIIGLPTDTVYGIGAVVGDEVAVGRLFALKQRPAAKALPVLAADIGRLQGVVDLGPHRRRLGEMWPGALSAVLRKAPGAPAWVGDERGTVAVRIPAHETALELLRRTGPMAVTSANCAGGPPTLTAQAAAAALGEAVSVYVAGTAPGGLPSTVIDLTGPKPVVLREGPMEWV